MTPKLLNSHRLAIGGAHHLHEAGHITAVQKDQYQAGSRKVLAQNKPAPPPMQKRGLAQPQGPVPFGSMAGPAIGPRQP
jgi:hypothetical protein